MNRLMKEAMTDSPMEDLRRRRQELYKKILQKQQLISKYETLLFQVRGNCSDYRQEYEMIDRMVFVREGRVNVLNSTDAREEKKKIPKKKIEDLTNAEASVLLEQLLAIRKRRQSE